MEWSLLFFLNSCLLGVGLAMDAFSVSLANGLEERNMSRTRMSAIALVFAVFQAAMPLIGWICVHTVMTYFTWFRSLIPWIAFILLCYIGGKMIYEAVKSGRQKGEDSGINDTGRITVTMLLLQGVATSIDALSVGFTIASYNLLMAAVCALFIAAITFFICLAGLLIGRKFGTVLSEKASLLGGVILIIIGAEILIKGLLA